MSMDAARESVLRKTADILLTARRTNTPIDDLPAEFVVTSEAEGFHVQDIMAEAFHPIGGWKIGAQGAEGVPFFAPMPAAWMSESGSLFRGEHRLRGTEAEIAFRIGTSLPPRATGYTRDEVIAAVASCHPAIEVIESAYVDPLCIPRPHMVADMQMHGGFVAGDAVSDWKSIDWSAEGVSILVDGSVRVENVGTAPGGHDLVRLLVYLANEGATRTGGLKAGDWITTGSWTGLTWASPGAEVLVEFKNAGRVALQFSPQDFKK